MTSFGTDVTAQTGTSDTSMKDKASTAADQSKQAATDVAHTAGQRAQDVKQEATNQARNLLGEAREHLTRQAGEQHQNLLGSLRSLSDELGSMSQSGEQGGLATELVGQARERIDGAAQWLDGKQPGDLVDEVRSFARRRPGAFLVGALAAGVVAGRLTRGVVATHTDDSSGGSESGNGSAGTLGTPSYESSYESAPPAGYATNGTYVPPAAGPQPEGSGYQPTTTYGTADPSPYARPGQYPGGTTGQGGLA